MDALTGLFRALAGGDDDEQPEDSIVGNTEGLCALSTVQRVYGFATCLVAGLALMILVRRCNFFLQPVATASFSFFDFSSDTSNLRSCSHLEAYWQLEAFLMEPSQQLRMMLDPVRVYATATAICIGFVVLALIFALWEKTFDGRASNFQNSYPDYPKMYG
ncbi:hypothetical protein ABZP36_025359 [Zizania latifolia]